MKNMLIFDIIEIGKVDFKRLLLNRVWRKRIKNNERDKTEEWQEDLNCHGNMFVNTMRRLFIYGKAPGKCGGNY